MIAAFFARIGSKVALIGGAIAAAALALWAMLAKAKRAGRVEVAAKAQERTIENVTKADEASDSVAAADPSERDKLRRKYTRK